MINNDRATVEDLFLEVEDTFSEIIEQLFQSHFHDSVTTRH